MKDNRNRIWVDRINSLLEEMNKTKKELAEGIGTSPSTISSWLSPEIQQEPKIIGFNAAAQFLGVSMDYLFGAEECKTPTDNEIYKMTGLSEKAIANLKTIKKAASTGSAESEKKISICNYLLGTMEQSTFLEDLYDYLFGEFLFENDNGNFTKGAERIISKSPSGKESKALVFSSVFSHAYLSMVYRDLSLMKDAADKLLEAREEVDYAVWKNSEEAKALDEEFRELLYNGDKGASNE